MFARDELPLIIDQIPAIIIANTDLSTKSGSHWILFYFYNNGNVEYFDSLGKTLTHYHKDFKIYNNCNYCKVQPRRALLSYPFHNMAAHMEATPTREGI